LIKMKHIIITLCFCLIFSTCALGDEVKPALVLPQTPAQLDYYVNQAHNGRLGQELSRYALLLPDLPTVMPAIKAGFRRDKRARFAVLGKINEFITENRGKAPLVIIIGENHNDPLAARYLNFFLRRIPAINYLGMEAFLNDPTKQKPVSEDEYKAIRAILDEKKPEILKLLERQEEHINVYDSKLLERLILNEGQQTLIDDFLKGDVAIPYQLNTTDILYGENALTGSPHAQETVRLLTLTILITAVNAIDEDGMLTRLETLELCREHGIYAFGFHQPVSIMDVAALSSDRNDYYTWTLDSYYAQVINHYLAAAKERNSVVMLLSIGAAHAERSHLPIFLPEDCRVFVVDLAATDKTIEDALARAKLGLETGWIDLGKAAKKEGYLGSRVANVYLRYPTPAEAPY
jgi:hypothetical protein